MRDIQIQWFKRYEYLYRLARVSAELMRLIEEEEGADSKNGRAAMLEPLCLSIVDEMIELRTAPGSLQRKEDSK